MFSAEAFYYFYVIISDMCTFYKLFASSIGGYKCEGQVLRLKDLDESAHTFLKDHNILSDDGQAVTISDIIVNKVTPFKIDVTQLCQIEICENHRKCLTVKHKSLRQKRCCISECDKIGEIKRRISFEASSKLYKITSQHVFVGSALCCKHRKEWLDQSAPVEDISLADPARGEETFSVTDSVRGERTCSVANQVRGEETSSVADPIRGEELYSVADPVRGDELCSVADSVRGEATCSVADPVRGVDISSEVEAEKTVDPDGWEVVLGSGLRKRIKKEGDGKAGRPGRGSRCAVNVLELLDSNVVGKDEQLQFNVGESDLMQALDLVVPLMQKGEVAEVKVEHIFAYGLVGDGGRIPPSTDLDLEVELVDWVELGPAPDIPLSERMVIRMSKRERGNSSGEYSLAVHCYRKAAVSVPDLSRGVGNSSEADTVMRVEKSSLTDPSRIVGNSLGPDVSRGVGISCLSDQSRGVESSSGADPFIGEENYSAARYVMEVKNSSLTDFFRVVENSSRAAADPAIEMENSSGTALVIEVDNSSVTDLAKKVGNSSGADLKQCDGQYLEEILLECSEVKVCNKRKSFLNASENIPKFLKSYSEISSILTNSQPVTDSQMSNFSDNSDFVMENNRLNFDKLLNYLRDIDPSIMKGVNTPLDLTVKGKTLKEYAAVVGSIWRLVLETVTHAIEEGSAQKMSDFVKLVVDTFDVEPKTRAK